MSLFTEIESFLGITSAVQQFETTLQTAEQAALVGLTVTSALVSAGATIADAAAAELEKLIPSGKTAIANFDAKVDGAEATLKTWVSEAQAWLAARTVTVAASAESGANASHIRVGAIHIA
jgi:hypothetical protein